jgi:SWI/SNF-related matrix-associated actin-dependent regulator of chromatin subfamily A3
MGHRHTVKDAVTMFKYHGPERHIEAQELGNYDIVMTTYGTIAAEFGKTDGILGRIRWYRIILDEGKSSHGGPEA